MNVRDLARIVTPDMVSLWVPSGYNRAQDIIRGNHSQCYGTHPNIPASPKLIDPELGWYFDGTDDYITIPDITFAGEFSVFFWALYMPAVNSMLFGHESDNSKVGQVGDTKLFIRVIHGGSSDNTLASFWDATNWHFGVITRNSSDKIDAYVNAGSANRLFSNVAQSGVYRINRFGKDSAAFFWKGYACLMGCANKAWSAAQVNNFYLATKGLFSPRG